MDSQDSSAPPPQFPSNHSLLMPQHNPIQHHFSNNSYPLPNSAMMHHQNPRFSAAAAPKPMDHHYSDGSPSGSGGAWFNIEPAKKKRGRPRKYSPDNSIGLGISAAPAAQAGDHGDSVAPSSETPNKRHRGRPPGSVKKQLDALGVPGVGFTPHVITVDSGEL